MADIATIDAAARVILMLCEDQVDMRTKLERIAYAAATIQHEAFQGLEKIHSVEEAVHV
jgi:hypothetical protein